MQNKAETEARVRAVMRRVFTCDEAVDEWMQTPARDLRDMSPIEMLAVDPDRVENYALRGIWGVP